MKIPTVFPDSENPPLLYFCDESHISPEFEFASIGALAVRPDRAMDIVSDLLKLRAGCNYSLTKEVQWKSVKRRRNCIHAAYINYLFDAIEAKQIHLHILFTPMRKYVNSADGKKRRSEVISKAYYQILLHRAGRFYGGDCRILVLPDNGECTEYLPKLRFGLNNKICERYSFPAAPISCIKPRSSLKEPILQLLDVTLGALTAAKNGRYRKDEEGSVRKTLVDLTLSRAKITDIDKSDSPNIRNQNIWNIQPKN